MKGGFRQSMAWLHTWSGLLVGWVLFAVFLTGTASYLRPEISLWMRPELPTAAPSPDAATVLVEGMRALADGAPGWTITLPDAREPAARVFWRDPAAPRGFRTALLDPATGAALTPRATLGGDFFYTFHFQLHQLPPPVGRWIISLCAMAMLVAIISGIVTHRRIFADFFTFRPRKGQRSWLDGHALVAVLGLPYHLMITYTGLVTLMLLTMPWGMLAAYDGNRQAGFVAEVFGAEPPGRPSGRAAPLAAIAPVLEEASRRWDGGRPGRILVLHPGDAAAIIRIERRDGERPSNSRQSVTFNGTTGSVIGEAGARPPAAETYGVLYGLHVGRFGGGPMRALFILSGVMGTLMVATGTILWAVKRRQARDARAGAGTRLVEILNVGTIAGLPVAVASFFWANRLLPGDLPLRAEWEVRVFFAAWGFAALHALLRPQRRAWTEQLGLGAALFLLLPILNAATTHSHLGVTLPAGTWALAGFDLTVAALGAALAGIAWLVGRPAPMRRRSVAPGATAAE